MITAVMGHSRWMPPQTASATSVEQERAIAPAQRTGNAAPGRDAAARTAPGRGVPAGAPPTTTPQRRPRLYVLDGFRLVAALMVVGYHYIGYGGGGSERSAWGRPPSTVFPHSVHATAAYGFLGVQLFFLISGFVISMSCWDRSLREFAVSRVSRLYPAYWLAVLATTLVLLISPAVRSPQSLRGVLANLTMFQGGMGLEHVDGVYWTLWVELRFYLLFSLVVALGTTYRRVFGFAAGWLAVAAVGTVWHPWQVDLVLMPTYAPYFVAGIAMYLMHRFGASRSLWVLLVASWGLALYAIRPLLATRTENVGIPLPWPVGAAVVTACFAVVLAAALGAFDRFQWRWLTVAGALTYPLYLLHENIGWTVIHGLRDRFAPGLIVAGVVAVMLVAAWLVHRWVERPLGRTLRKRLSGRRAPVPATAPSSTA